MKKGFYFNIGQKEFFVETEKKNKTQKLASDVLHKMLNFGFNIPDTPATRKELLYYMIPAFCEIKHCNACPDLNEPEGFDYYNIFGDGFGGYGSRVDDGKTIVFAI